MGKQIKGRAGPRRQAAGRQSAPLAAVSPLSTRQASDFFNDLFASKGPTYLRFAATCAKGYRLSQSEAQATDIVLAAIDHIVGKAAAYESGLSAKPIRPCPGLLYKQIEFSAKAEARRQGRIVSLEAVYPPASNRNGLRTYDPVSGYEDQAYEDALIAVLDESRQLLRAELKRLMRNGSLKLTRRELTGLAQCAVGQRTSQPGKPIPSPTRRAASRARDKLYPFLTRWIEAIVKTYDPDVYLSWEGNRDRRLADILEWIGFFEEGPTGLANSQWQFAHDRSEAV